MAFKLAAVSLTLNRMLVLSPYRIMVHTQSPKDMMMVSCVHMHHLYVVSEYLETQSRRLRPVRIIITAVIYHSGYH